MKPSMETAREDIEVIFGVTWINLKIAEISHCRPDSTDTGLIVLVTFNKNVHDNIYKQNVKMENIVRK